MKELKPLFVKVVTFSAEGDFNTIGRLDRALKNICRRLESEKFYGSIRVITEHVIKDVWEFKLVSPPVPKNHPLCHMLEGVMYSVRLDRRVNSFESELKQVKF